MKAACLFFFAIAILGMCHACKTQKKLSGDSATPLKNTYWRLEEANGKPVITPADAKEVHLLLSDDGHVSGFGGCNAAGGSFTLSGKNGIHFQTISTKMYCQSRMDVEDFFFQTLQHADHYRIEGEDMFLYQGDKQLAHFHAQPSR